MVTSAIDSADQLINRVADTPTINQEAIDELRLNVEQPNRMYNPRLRISLVDFPPAIAKASDIDIRLVALQSHLQSRLFQANGSTVKLTLDGETLVLQGTVPNTQQKNLVERIVRLEPGISTVRNELAVKE
jgi:hypothetical protein